MTFICAKLVGVAHANHFIESLWIYLCVFLVLYLKTTSLNSLKIIEKSLITEYSDPCSGHGFAHHQLIILLLSSGLNVTLSLPSPWNGNHACFKGGTCAKLQGSSGSTWMRSIVCRLCEGRLVRLRSGSHTRMFSSKCSDSKLHIFGSSYMPSSWWCLCAGATSSLLAIA